MSFDEAVAYLLGLGHETLAVKLGLENIERLLAALDHPHLYFPSVQIAGTNGKGSTAAMLDAICRAAGVRAGLYTSPHLVSLTERISIAGELISNEEFARQTFRVREAARQLQGTSGALPTFFEQVTAIALLAFRDAGIQLAILETGLGGRLDATTAARAATVAITPVALDHQEYLGPTLAEIAAEKAAVIRATVRAVVAPRLATEARVVILARCHEQGVAPRFATRDWQIHGATPDGRLRATFRTSQDVYEDVPLALRGRHQLTNAAVAIELAEDLREQGFSISRAAIIEGLATARHAGRLELIPGTPAILFDGAHNPAGARALRDYFDEFTTTPITLIFGAMRDKDLQEITATLFPAARQLILTQPTNPRAASVADVRHAAPLSLPTESGRTVLASPPAEALDTAMQLTPPDGIICVTGSLYLIGEMKRLLADRRRGLNPQRF